MAKVKEEKTDAVEFEPRKPVFTKEKILRMGRYQARRDLLAALLIEGRGYTFEEVDILLEKFMKGVS